MRIPFASATLSFATLVGAASFVAMAHPKTPLPPEWNPMQPLSVAHPVTPVTAWKLRQTASDETACFQALNSTMTERLSPLIGEGSCGIAARVRVWGVGEAALSPVETDCAVALKLAMWERHTVQPAARNILQTGVSQIEHLSSYSCRPIRTPEGTTSRMSTHATGEAIDITGFVMDNGRRITLVSDWDGGEDAKVFLREVRDGSCRWFSTTLGPDFNSLHQDHFHFQSRGWGLCR
jgi:hypothetical protein